MGLDRLAADEAAAFDKLNAAYYGSPDDLFKTLSREGRERSPSVA